MANKLLDFIFLFFFGVNVLIALTIETMDAIPLIVAVIAGTFLFVNGSVKK